MADPQPPVYFSVLMPVFNEEGNVGSTIAILDREFAAAGCSYEIIVIDDHSRDNTLAVVREVVAQNPNVHLYRHRHNLGPGSGIYTGIALARGTFVIFIPADLAMDPGELRKFIDASRDADVVNGLRSDRRDYNFFRTCMSLVNITLIQWLFGMRLQQFNYIQAYRRAMFDRFYPQSIGVLITAEILVLARDHGYRTVEVEIEYRPRMIGTTGVANWRAIRRTLLELGAFWVRWVWRRAAGAPRFDADQYKRDHVLPLVVPD